MREDVKKYLFVGPEDEKERFFVKAQSLGIIHFIDPLAGPRRDIPDDVRHVTTAIKVLRGLPPHDQEENFEELDCDTIANAILKLHERNEQLFEEMRVLNMEIARISVYGDFSLEDVGYIEKEGKCKIQFFVGRPNLYQYEPEPEGLVFVASEHGFDYYIAVNDRPVVYDKLIEMKFDRSLSDLKKGYAQAQKEHHQVDHELRQYTKYNEYLHQALVEKLNEYHLYNAQTYVQEVLGGSVFAVEGWVPVNKEALLNEAIAPLDIYADEVTIEPTDVIPTYLENEGQARLGQDLVSIYDTPSHTDKDPSMWVLYGFALFFAMIIGDAGYGLIYLALALFLRYKNPNLKGLGKRVLDLFTFLCVACVIWGTLMTSFFGMQIDLDNPLRKVSLLQWLAEKKAEWLIEHHDESVQEWVKKYPELNAKDPHQFVSYSEVKEGGKHYVILNKLTDNIMFELALFIGIVHLILSFSRYLRRNWQNIGWIAFLIGAYLYFPYYLKVPSFLNFVGGVDLERGGEIGLELMFAGIGVAWVLSIIKHGWTGIFEVMTLIQVFADSLSYLRLYALGLAGAIVGSTVNEIASGMPLFVGVLLVVCAHAINIVLGTMSGIIHGLRLNFLEWYHYSFEGGGKEFQPLKRL